MSAPGEWDAKTYHQISEPQLRWGRAVLARMELRGDETVLDAGCGSGRLTADLVARVPRGHVVALDRSAPMLAEARANLAAFGDARVTVREGDLGDLRLDRTVDAVFSAATFHWVLDHDALFEGMARAMRPGALLEAQCGGEGNLAGTLSRAMAWVMERVDAAHFAEGSYPAYFADAASTEARLRRSGFTDVRAWLEDAPTPFDDAASYRLFLEKVVLARVLERLARPDDRTALLDHMADAAARDATPYSLDYVRLNLHARRAP